ncbi:MAG: DHH family phosphoesterase [Pyrobaculum sp.]
MLEKLVDLLGGARKVAIITHRRADADALACANVLKLVLNKLGVEVLAIVCPEGSSLGNCVEEMPKDAELYILVDVASLHQVPRIDKKFFKIDHHAVGDNTPGLIEERPSCTEIAVALAEEAGVEIPQDVAALAVLGIYTDTVKLKKADADTLNILSKLLKKSGGTLGDIVKDNGERRFDVVIALLKGMQRVQIYRSSLGVICTSYVSAHESDLAAMLIAAGCRIALVASKKKNGVYIILRSRGVDISHVVKKFGEGGGHREAAVVVVKERLDKGQLPQFLDKVVKTIDPEAELIQ